MAISKKRKGAAPGARPNAEAFLRVIDDGLAEPAVVASAYRQALTEWLASDDGEEQIEVVTERPDIDESPSPEGRLILINRHYTFKNATPQEES